MMPINFDKRLAAVCGLFCPACHAFIATRENPERLASMARRYDRTIEDLQCDGCRSAKRCFFCREKCVMMKCASQKGIDFCGECKEYPCQDLKEFQAAAPHRIELWKSQSRIKEVGYERWYAEMIELYSCPACRTINSAYDLTCSKCGQEPSCEYVKLHGDAIRKHLAKTK
jgi:hypothetical protein